MNPSPEVITRSTAVPTESDRLRAWEQKRDALPLPARIKNPRLLIAIARRIRKSLAGSRRRNQEQKDHE